MSTSTKQTVQSSASGPSNPTTTQAMPTATVLPALSTGVTTTLTETTSVQNYSNFTSISTTPTTNTFSSPSTIDSPSSTMKTSTLISTSGCNCHWSDWSDHGGSTTGPDGGEVISIESIIKSSSSTCSAIKEIQCRAKRYPGVPLSQLGQDVKCNIIDGLVCLNKHQGLTQQCYDYDIRVLCCDENCDNITTQTFSTAPTTLSSTSFNLPSSPTSTVQISSSVSVISTDTSIKTPTSMPLTTVSGDKSSPPTTTLTSHISSTNTSTSTTPSKTSPTFTTSKTGTLTSSPECNCQWSDWNDFGGLTTGPDGGEIVPIERITETFYSCSTPKEVQCRAKRYPGVPVSQLGQVIKCNTIDGLVCLNRHQGLTQQCYDYEVRLFCCDENCSNITTQTSSTDPATISTSTKQTVQSSASGPSNPTTTQAMPTATALPALSTGVTTTLSETTSVQNYSNFTSISTTPTTNTFSSPSTIHSTPTTMKTSTLISTSGCNCHWSDWSDHGGSTTGPDGGEVISIESIIKSSLSTCSAIKEIQCRAKRYPGVPLSQLGQDVKCNIIDGLVCLNKHQGLTQQCYDYDIRVLCCDENCDNITTQTFSTASTTVSSTSLHLPSSTTSTVQISSSVSVISTDTSIKTPTSMPLTTVSGDKSSPPTTTITSHISSTYTSTSTTPSKTSPTFTTSKTGTFTSIPECNCHWSDWNDFGGLTTGPDGGEIVPIERITETFYSCSTPKEVQCRAKRYPGVPVSQLGQVIKCNTIDGLVCLNRHQGLTQQCYDYEVRLFCCNENCGNITTQTSSTDPATMSTSTKQTVQSSASGPSNPTTTQAMPTATALPALSTGLTTTLTETTSVQNYSNFTSISTTPTTNTFSSPSTIHSTPTTMKTSTLISTSGCNCHWSDWSDHGGSTTGPDGGEVISIESIIESSSSRCSAIKEIQCRAKRYPGVPLSQLGQDVKCNTIDGLVCFNRNQGLTQQCYDYEVRLFCCDENCDSITTQTFSTAPTTLSSTSFNLPSSTTSTVQISSSVSVISTDTSMKTPTSMPLTTVSGDKSSPLTTTLTSHISSTNTSTSTTPSKTSPTFTTSKTGTFTSIPECNCHWSDWNDFGGLTTGPDGGEIVPIERITETFYSCSTPKEVQCRAKRYPGVPVSQLGQVIKCNTIDGLVCLNRHQGLTQQCYDYEVRLFCCDENCDNITTQTSSTDPATMSTSTKQTVQSSASGPSNPTTTQAMPTATVLPALSTGVTTTLTETTSVQNYSNFTSISTTPTTNTFSSPSTIDSPSSTMKTSTLISTSGCNCHWSDWSDHGGSTTGPDGGEVISIESIIKSSSSTCSAIKEIQCRAKRYPGVPLSQLGQDVKCNIIDGLVCLNKHQGLTQQCYDYDIRVLCCDENCDNITTQSFSTAPTTLSSTSFNLSSSPTSTVRISSSVSVISTDTSIKTPTSMLLTTVPGDKSSPPTTTFTSHISSTNTSTSTTPSKTSPTFTTLKTGTLTSSPECNCHWSDWNDFGGLTTGPDGGEIVPIERITEAFYSCTTPKEVQCRAKRYPEVPVSQLGQVIKCNTIDGLVCLNRHQRLTQQCYDYEVRLFCCDENCDNITTQTSSTDPATMSTSTKQTVQSSASGPSNPTTTQAMPTATALPALSTGVTTTLTETTSVQIYSNFTSISTTPKTNTFSSPSTINSTPTTMKTSTLISTSGCNCHWSDWSDHGGSTTGPDGGEVISIESIIKSSSSTCSAIKEIQCRAKRYPGVPLSQLGQDVKCNIIDGLVCLNKHQGLTQQCYDYDIRVLCCDENCDNITTQTFSTAPTTLSSTSFNLSSSPTSTVQMSSSVSVISPDTSIKTPTSMPLTTVSGDKSSPPTTTLTSHISSSNTSTSTTPSKTSPTFTTSKTGTFTSSPECNCHWSDWNDFGGLTTGPDGGEIVPIERITETFYSCSTPKELQCRAKRYPGVPVSQLGQVIKCNTIDGLVCLNRDQGLTQQCYDYEIRLFCCDENCSNITTQTSSTDPATMSTSTKQTVQSSASGPSNPTTTQAISRATPLPALSTGVTTTLTETTSVQSYSNFTSISTTPTANTFSSPSTIHLTPTTMKTSTLISTSGCNCHWSDWSDHGGSTTGPDGGYFLFHSLARM
nr:mucin-5AC-like [Danio rerio]|eukprot:XP_021333305.1 mucin-5AC-like [Danio rerio]